MFHVSTAGSNDLSIFIPYGKKSPLFSGNLLHTFFSLSFCEERVISWKFWLESWYQGKDKYAQNDNANSRVVHIFVAKYAQKKNPLIRFSCRVQRR